MKPLIPATLAFTADGVPFSNVFDDVYHSADGGLGQARHVFLDGNGLPERWRGEDTFTIVETGFGLGLNFLATWQAFNDDLARPQRLHFVSVEKHPFSVTDLRTLHRQWPEFAALSLELIDRWPTLISGFHRLHLCNDRITLTLLFGDAIDLLPTLQAQANAFYLDGFSPSKNTDLWSPIVLNELARLAAPQATLATYTVASTVRDALIAAGFTVEKAPGFGRKRAMLTGRFCHDKPTVAKHKHRRAIIIGAGLAGTHCAERLAARGWDIDLIERHALPAQEASGNPSGVLRPILNMKETANARFSRTAFLYALRHNQAVNREIGIQWSDHGLLHLADPREAARLAQMIELHGLPPDLAQPIDADEATKLAGIPILKNGCWFPRGAWVNPPSLCKANLDRHATRITRHMSIRALRLQTTADGEWQVYTETSAMIAEAPVVILANSFDCKTLQPANPLPLRAVRGQLTYLPELPEKKLAIGITGDGYIAPMQTGGYCIGATFQRDDSETQARPADHIENLARLESLLPGFANGINAATLSGRVAWRATTPDRMPIFGPLENGLYAAVGLGARGLVWAALGAELLAAMINEEPWPLERELVEAMCPSRFLMPLI